jgi:hypothetical protein
VEEVEGTERYRDCIGIRAAAQRVDALSAIQTINITYYSDYGGPGQAVRGTCPEGGLGPILNLGDQVVVEVISNFDPIVPMVPININQVEAESARTVVKDVPVGVLVPPLIPPTTELPPWISFRSYYSFISESCGVDPDCAEHGISIPIKITDEFGNENVNVAAAITVDYWISGLSEARYGYDYTIAGYDEVTNSGQVTINPGADNPGTSIPVTIINDTLFEYYERVIIYLSDATEGNIVWPNVHVLYIIDDDRIPPVVQFVDPSSEVDEDISDGWHGIDITLDKPSGRDTVVPIELDSEDPGTATLGLDYLLPGSITIQAGLTSGSFEVPIFDDSLLEGDETVRFVLGQPTNAVLGDPLTHNNEHVLTILDNENAPPVCNLSITYTNNNKTARLTNNGSYPIYLTRVYVRWTANNNQNLSFIDFGGMRIWSSETNTPPPIADITITPRHINHRMLSEQKNLLFTFSSSGNITITTVRVWFDNGCSITYGDPYP